MDGGGGANRTYDVVQGHDEKPKAIRHESITANYCLIGGPGILDIGAYCCDEFW